MNEMPVYLVITKVDKIMSDEVEEVKEHISKTMQAKMNLQKLQVAVTSAEEGNAEEFKEILRCIQNQSDELFKKFFSGKLCSYLYDVRTYLEKQLSLRDTNIEQLQADKELLEEKIKDLRKNVEEEKANFEKQAEECVSAIQERVENELRSNSSNFENLIMQDYNIQDKVNFIVRNAITYEMRNRFEPKLKRYISNISDMVQTDCFQNNSNQPLLQKTEIEDNENMRNALKTATAPIATAIGSVVGTLIGGPIGTAIGAAIGGIIGTLFSSGINKSMREKEEAQKREAAEQRVSQIIASVTSSVRPQIEANISGIIEKVNAEIDASITEQENLHRKALNDLEEKLSKTSQERETLENQLKDDLCKVKSMLEQETA